MAQGGVITSEGKNTFWHRSYTASPTITVPSKIKIGIGTTTPVAGDTSLVTEIPIYGTEEIDNFDATTGWAAGTDSAVSTNTSTYKIGTASLSLAKTGTTGTTGSMSKATTSLDFTSKDLWGWVYITDVTDLVATGTAISVRFGSGASDYYQYDINITSLANGWNYFTFNTTTASSTTGTPTIAACDYTLIEYNTDLAADTVAADRIMFDDFRLASTDDYKVDYMTGYPTFDTVNNKVTVRCLINSLQANGWNLTEVGEFNTDTPELLISRDVFSSISKSNTDELLFIITHEAL